MRVVAASLGGGVKAYVDEALRFGDVAPSGANGYSITYDLGRAIGTDQGGAAVSGIRVYIRNRVIQTAIPVAP
jgi:hypothetical protein